MIKINFNDKKVQLLLQDFKNKAINTKFALLRIGFLINHDIQNRVQTRGEGLNGAKLPAYSVKYGAYRQRKGRTAFRNLTFTGRMFASLTARTIGANKVLLGFGGPEVAKAKGNNERTPFFGIDRSGNSIIASELAKIFGR